MDLPKNEAELGRRLPETVSEGRAVVPDHELIRRVGQGAYGEVWLARNVMGTYRAVKIVYRSRFSDKDPYEREFSGIRKYEPVSRTNDGLVHILQVGRNDEEEYFYYVMDLADDAGEPPVENPRALEVDESARASHVVTRDPLEYVPRTLHREIGRRGRLPVEECCQIGLSLIQALAHLHGRNLLHRDIKPSNVIFVEGIPKLADIGLVTEATEARTFVGTEGFIPPEGPNSGQADLYSLGMVLYEISSGKKARDFPEPCMEMVRGEERAAWLELNAVILKACAADPRQRYASAEEMQEELSLLHRGKSVVARHSRRRLLTMARHLAFTAALLVVLVAAGYLIARKSVRITPVAPQRLSVNDAEFWFPENRNFDFSTDGERIVFAGKKGVWIWDRATQVNRPLRLSGLATFQDPGDAGWRVPGRVPLARWAPDSRHIIFRTFKKVGGTIEAPIKVWAWFLVNADTKETRQIGSELPDAEQPLDLCWLRDGKGITYVDLERRVYTLSLTGGRALWVDARFSGQGRLELGGYSRDGNWLLLSAISAAGSSTFNESDIWVMPHGGGRALPVVSRAGFDGHPTWGPDGETIYFVSNDEHRLGSTWGLWKVPIDLATGSPGGPVQPVLVQKGVTQHYPRFVADGKRLVYAVEQPESKVWVAGTAQADQPAPVVGGREPVPSPDGQTIFFVGETPAQQGVYGIGRNGDRTSVRQITDLVPLGNGLTRGGFSLSPDGQWIALFSSEERSKRYGIFVVSTGGGQPRLVEEWPEWEDIVPTWSPDSQWLAYSMDETLYRASRDGDAREALATLYRWQGWTLRWSPDGKHIAALAYASPRDFEERPDFGSRNGVFMVSIADKTARKLSPDGEEGMDYREGLEWHPNGQSLTYMRYGPDKLGASIKRLYLNDGRIEQMIDQPDHWDYIGLWAPGGREFFFISNSCHGPDLHLHTFDAVSKEITHGLRGGSFPVWSQDTRTVVWATEGRLRYFEELTDIR